MMFVDTGILSLFCVVVLSSIFDAPFDAARIEYEYDLSSKSLLIL